MTPLQREALQMCLEYIETDAHERRHVRWKINEALAEPATEDSSAVQPASQPQQEPVAYIEHHKGGDNLVWDDPGGKRSPLYTSPQPAQQEPVYVQTRQQGFSDWGSLLDPKHRNSKWAEGVEMRLLYTSPQPAQQQEPDLSGLKPSTQEVIKGWIEDGTFIERAIGAMQEQEAENMRLEKALAEQPAQQQEPMDEIRCPECGYLTKHTEHIGCLRNQLNAINAFEQRNFAIVNMDTSPQPAQPLPFGVGGGLVAIKTLLSRDPCGHANTAIQMIDAILAEQPAQQDIPDLIAGALGVSRGTAYDMMREALGKNT